MKTSRTKELRHLLFQALLMSMLCLLSSCRDGNSKEISSDIPNDWIQGLPESVSFKVSGGEQIFQFTLGEGVEASKIEYIMTEGAESWCKVSIGSDNIKIEATPYGYSRETYIKLIYDKDHQKSLKVLQITDFSDYFKDYTCSELKDGITREDVETIPNEDVKELALMLLNNRNEGVEGYLDPMEQEFRITSIRPYQHPEVMAKKNKTAKYSIRDNVTGIWAKQGEEILVMVGKIYEGGKIELMFHGPDQGYGNSKNVPVVEGLNRITAPITGQIYVMNHVQDDIPLLLNTNEAKQAADAKTIGMHFIKGRVTGYIDRNKHFGTTDNAWKKENAWKDILANAGYEFIDLVGNYAHVTWKAKQWREKNTPLDVMIENWDNLVYWEQEFAGLVKYNRMFNNRMHICADYAAKSPNASDYRTVYNTKSEGDNYYDEVFYSPERYKERVWVFGHEVGHCNQLRPGVKWSGMTEVTNNIYCLYIQEKLGNPCKLQVDQINCKDENGKELGKKIIYDAAIELIVDGQRAHCLPNIKDIVRESQLVPFWQLYLYIVKVKGQSEFYKDLYEYFRNNSSPSEKGEGAGMDQLDFVRQVCRIANLDLTDFYEKWGFLKAVDTTLNDYGNKKFSINQSDIDKLKKEIKNAGYERPAADVHKITDNTIGNYN